MRRKLAALLRHTRGSAAVEFALVVPLAIVMLLGAMNFGIYLYFQNSLSTAIDETARSLTVWPVPDETQVQTNFSNALLTASTFGSAKLDVAYGTTTLGRDYVDLTATGSYAVNLVFFNFGAIPVRVERRSFIQS